jgi:3-oxoacyl-[acyl-carrier protein] reductase
MSGQQVARFDGQVALVTGGGSGIGAAVARRLGPFLSQARQFAADARPAVGGQTRTIRSPGPGPAQREFIG